MKGNDLIDQIEKDLLDDTDAEEALEEEDDEESLESCSEEEKAFIEGWKKAY